MNPFRALIATIKAFLSEAAPEVRERCTDTTYQKLQGLLVQLEGFLAEEAMIDAMPVGDLGELIPDLGELIPRVMAAFEKQEAQLVQREEIQAKQLVALERITTLLFDTGTPAA